MLKSAYLACACLAITACTEAIAPKNAGTGVKKAAEGVNADANPAANTESPDGAGTDDNTNGSDNAATDDGQGPVNAVAPLGEAKGLAGSWTDLNLKYVYASLTPAKGGAGALLMMTASEVPANMKSIKSYNCKPCSDDIDACYCADTTNGASDRCKATAGNKRTFSVVFSAPADALPAPNKDAIQVKADGFPKKADYELLAVPVDVTDPAYATAATANGNQGMSIIYSQTSPAKSRTSAVGTVKFTGTAPTASGNDWTATLDVKFVPNSLLGDTGGEETLKATLSGKVFKAPTYAVPSCKALPDEYSEPVYE